MNVEEFDAYGATRGTLRQFCNAPGDVVKIVRDVLIPDPDICCAGIASYGF